MPRARSAEGQRKARALQHRERRRSMMASYVMLFSFTGKGIEHLEESPARVEAAKNICRELGGEVKHFFGLMGRYDTMFVLEAPDDAAAMKMAAAICKKGNVRSETLRAFNEDEYRDMLSGLPR
jgi:uncharacterized protein with GYD domain